MALIFVTLGVVLGAANATVTVTHSLGTTPDFVDAIPNGTSTNAISVLTFNNTTVLVAGQNITAQIANICVRKHHSIIQ